MKAINDAAGTRTQGNAVHSLFPHGGNAFHLPVYFSNLYSTCNIFHLAYYNNFIVVVYMKQILDKS